MDGDGLRRRCPRSRLLGRADLLRHRFVLMGRSGYASVRPDAAATVHGMLIDLDPADVAALDAYEDVGGGLYDRAQRDVRLADGDTRRASIYLGVDRSEGGAPPPGYMESIVAAARAGDLPASYVKGLEAHLPAKAFETCRDLPSLRARVRGWRAAGERIALVPTMGSLHAGHMALVEAARARADRTIVTVFVNPTQFAPGEDFASYPRDFAADSARIAQAGADLVYAPDVPTIYPEGFATTVEVGGPARAGLEDRFRPTHFAGVATVVAKLMGQAQPDLALFGEKDYQQLRVIERVVRDLDLPVAVAGVATVREADGLALSSRNAYLDASERARASGLHRALAACAGADDAELPASVASARAALAQAGFAIDYVEARHAVTLAPVAGPGEPVRLLAAVRLGRTRLIDNVAIKSIGPKSAQRFSDESDAAQ